jgi:hypothetical protein
MCCELLVCALLEHNSTVSENRSEVPLRRVTCSRLYHHQIARQCRSSGLANTPLLDLSTSFLTLFLVLHTKYYSKNCMQRYTCFTPFKKALLKSSGYLPEESGMSLNISVPVTTSSSSRLHACLTYFLGFISKKKQTQNVSTATP